MVHPLETEDAAERCARQLWRNHGLESNKSEPRGLTKDDIIRSMVAVFITTYRFRQEPEGYEETDAVREWRDEAFQAYTRMVTKAFERIIAEETRGFSDTSVKTLTEYFAAMFPEAGSDDIDSRNDTMTKPDGDPTTNGTSHSNGNHLTNGTVTTNGNGNANGGDITPTEINPFQEAEFDAPAALDEQVFRRRLKPAVTAWPKDIADKNEHDYLRRLWVVLAEDRNRLAEEELENKKQKEDGKRKKAASSRRGGGEGAKGRKERRRQKQKEKEEGEQEA